MISKAKKSYIVQAVLIIGGIMGVIAALYYSGIADSVTLEKIQLKSAALKAAVDAHYVEAIVLFTFVFIALISATLPVVGPLTMLSVYLFGFIPGFVVALIGSTFGSTLSFLIIRYALSSLIRSRYKVRLEKFNEKIKVYGHSYLLTLQILSVIPYVVINTLAALTEVSMFTSFWTTLVGSTPLIFLYALAGRQLGTLHSVHDIFSPQIFFILIALAAVALLPMLVRRFKKEETFDESDE
jgi:uncharacterized membrane protein YdjX (TVP38/TMEM64 family)